MDLVEDYLHAVALLLPKAQRDDIIAELRDTILTRVEAKESELGRKLTEDETEAVLREIGHPLLVAARYREGPQHLVGPALYPYWAFAVKLALTIVAVVAAVSFVVRLLATGDVAYALGTAMASAIGGAVSLIGAATIIAWVVERRGGSIDYLDRWRVRDLKGLEFLAWDLDTLHERLAGRPGPQPSRPAPGASRRELHRAERRARRHARRGAPVDRAIGAMVVGVVILFWWLGLLPFGLLGDARQMRQLGLEPGPLAAVNWNEVRELLFWPVIVYCAAIIAQGVVLWSLPRAVRLHGLMNLAIAAMVLAAAAWIWTASPISPQIHADSVADLLLQVKAALRQPPPKPIAPFVALVLALIALGAVGRALHGLVQLILGAPPESSLAAS